MANLNTLPRIARPDELYARLLALHDGLDLEESTAVNARIILLLANHIGDESVVFEAFALAASPGMSA